MAKNKEVVFWNDSIQEIAKMRKPVDKDQSLLQLSKISINEDYRKKWNIHENDFVCLSKNGELLRNTLYRIGGLNTPNLNKDKYFMLLKYVEAFYPKEIMTMSKGKDPKHLEGRWCILDKQGNEKVEFGPFKSPYLVKDSCIYSIDSHYYNIETGEYYCHAYNTMESKTFLFLENNYDKDRAKRGIMKIDKETGNWELYSSNK